MKNRLMSIPAAAALAAGMLLAQTPAPQPGPGHHQQHQGNWQQGRLERLATFLDLTPQQREQATAIFQQAKQSAEPVAQQLRQGRQAMIDAVKSGKPDTDIDRLANSQGVLMGQLAAIHTKAMAKVYALLTPEQKQKADQLHDLFKGGFGRHFGPRNG